MIKKWIAVFLVFFLGTLAIISVDQTCRETTGCGGKNCLSIHKTEDGGTELSFFGLTKEM